MLANRRHDRGYCARAGRSGGKGAARGEIVRTGLVAVVLAIVPLVLATGCHGNGHDNAPSTTTMGGGFHLVS